jgi:hypothetical protein
MQIIDKNDCYVSKDDLLYLFDNDECMPLSLQIELRSALINNSDYVKVNDEIGLEYIYNSSVPTFNDLSKLKIAELKRRIHAIIIEDMIRDNEGENLPLNEVIREKRNRQYMIKQLKEMIAFKKKKPKVLYPDIPYPYLMGITNGNYNACSSYNLDRVIIYNIDGSIVSDVDDIEFCKSSFRLLTYNTNPDDELDMNFDGNYFVVKSKQKNLKRKRIVD